MKLAFALASAVLLAKAQSLAIVNVSVVEVEAGRARPGMTVLIDGRRITAVAPTARLKTPRKARVLDGRGRYLIPGLWDMHVHMFTALPPGPEDTAMREYFVPAFLAQGITGVRSMYDDPGAIRKLRERMPDFEVVASGPILDGDPPYLPTSLRCKDAEQAREAVRKVKRDGADFIKVYSLLPRDAYLAIADEAKASGLPFSGHLPNSVSAIEASDAGQKSFEHLMGVPDDPAVFARFVKNGTWQTPTLIALRSVALAGEPALDRDPRLGSVPDPLRQLWKMLAGGMPGGKDAAARAQDFERQLHTVAAMHRAGVKLLAGSDTPNPYVFPGSSLHDELELLVRAGLTPADALRCATIRPAEFLNRLDRSGTVAVGKDADLVLLDADPLLRPGNTRRIAAVILKGIVQ